MDKYFGQRGSYPGGNKNLSFRDIANQQAAQKTGCEAFFNRYIKKILEEGALSAHFQQRQSFSPLQMIKELITSDPVIKGNSVDIINLTEDEIYADIEQVKFAFQKVIENAVHYSVGKTVATIQIEKTDNAVLFIVKDQGIGICSEEKEKVFQPFFRGIDSAKFAKGIGLGLTISKEIFKHHNAEIFVESAGKGLGTSFYISFPFESKNKLKSAVAGRPTEEKKRMAY